jgi:hypothetical protein
MAEEIALQLVLDAAGGIVADEVPELEFFIGGMPKSRFDFDLLHDILYQDKDYEIAYLSNWSIAKPGDLEEWFEDFQTPAPTDPERGFTGKDADHTRGVAQSVVCSCTEASGADEESLRPLGLADPVHLDDDHAFAADVGQ